MFFSLVVTCYTYTLYTTLTKRAYCIVNVNRLNVHNIISKDYGINLNVNLFKSNNIKYPPFLYRYLLRIFTSVIFIIYLLEIFQ